MPRVQLLLFLEQGPRACSAAAAEILHLRDRDHWLVNQPPAAGPPGVGGVGGAPAEGASPVGARAAEELPPASEQGGAAEAAEAKEAGEERVKEKKKKKKKGEKKEKDRKRKRSRSSRGGREESVEVAKSPGGKELKKGGKSSLGTRSEVQLVSRKNPL